MQWELHWQRRYELTSSWGVGENKSSAEHMQSQHTCYVHAAFLFCASSKPEAGIHDLFQTSYQLQLSSDAAISYQPQHVNFQSVCTIMAMDAQTSQQPTCVFPT